MSSTFTCISIFLAIKYKGFLIKFKDYQACLVHGSDLKNICYEVRLLGKVATIWATCTFGYDDTYSGQLWGLICWLVNCGLVVDGGIVHTASLAFGGFPFVHGCGSPVLITGVIIISEEALLFSVIPVFYLIFLTGLLLPLHLPIIIQLIYCHLSSVKFKKFIRLVIQTTGTILRGGIQNLKLEGVQVLGKGSGQSWLEPRGRFLIF